MFLIATTSASSEIIPVTSKNFVMRKNIPNAGKTWLHYQTAASKKLIYLVMSIIRASIGLRIQNNDAKYTYICRHQKQAAAQNAVILVITKYKNFLSVYSLDATCTLNFAWVSKFFNEARRRFRFLCAISRPRFIVP